MILRVEFAQAPREDMRERMGQMMDELRAGPPFDVFSLAAPSLRPRVLAETGKSNNGWHLVSLFYGKSTSATGPTVAVRSAMQWRVGPHEPRLADALDDERDRLFDHAGLDEPDPSDPPVRDHARIALDDEAVDVEVLRSDGLWAARLELPGSPDNDAGAAFLVVTVVARGVPLEAVRLARVADLNPFIRGRARTLASLAGVTLRAGLANRQGTGEPVPRGDAALWALIEFCVASSQAHEDAARADRRPRTRPRDSGQRRHALWQAAVDAQARAWRQSREPANEQVTVMVNHMTHLAQRSTWFRSAPELRQAAIDETIAYTAHGEAVESAPAHRACWANVAIGEHPTPAPRGLPNSRPGRRSTERDPAAGTAPRHLARGVESLGREARVVELTAEWVSAAEKWGQRDSSASVTNL